MEQRQEFDGTLFFRGDGTKRKLFLRFTTRNGKNWENPIGENLLSQGVSDHLKENETSDELAVKLHEEGGRPTAIYLDGESPRERMPKIAPEHRRKDFGQGQDRQSTRTPKRPDSGRQREVNNMSGEFHNPYNFVPAIPRGDVSGELGDRPPSGHDRFIDDKFTGKLTVKMTVKTPLVVLDTARIERKGDHSRFPVRVDADGKPYIAPTAVKGMLRSAYEAVTNSRMSVFTKHRDRLAFRAEVEEGLFVVPARIEGTKGNEEIVLYTGCSDVEGDGGPKIVVQEDRKRGIREKRQSQFAAWLGLYTKSEFITVNGIRVFKPTYFSANDAPNEYPRHSKKAHAWIEEFNHGRRPFSYWKVMELSYDPAKLSKTPVKSAGAISSSPKKVEGYVCNTGKTMPSKHDERFFFGKSTTNTFALERRHVQAWDRLIKDYRKQHESDLDSPPKARVDGGEYSLEWSRHIQRTTKEELFEDAELKEENLKDRALCYAKVRKNAAGKFDVLELYPVMISRRLHKVSPESLLGECLRPASDMEKLSPTDRVFGWVNQSGSGAYRGQVRVGSVGLSDDWSGRPINNIIQKFGDANNSDTWLPMNILGQPKPKQGRFYVAKNKDGDAQDPRLSNEAAGYNTPEEKGLRGRKVYPHHSHIDKPEDFWFVNEDPKFRDDSDDYWKTSDKTYFREFLRPRGKKENSSAIVQQRDKQNRSIEGWIKPGTEFEFDIHFTNLSKVELGALIWLLDMDKYANESGETEEYFHRFGGGKPYGFGSAKLELGSAEITSGEDLKTYYGSLDAERAGTSVTPEHCVEAYQQAIASVSYAKILEAFKVACRGFSDGLPIHYPRARNYRVWNGQIEYIDTDGRKIRDDAIVPPNPDGKSYEWFVANAKAEIKERQDYTAIDILPDSEPGRESIRARIPLGNLWDDENEDPGLPILPHKKSRD